MRNFIFITGGASGIGEASVRLFHSRGWNVAFTDLNEETGHKLVQELGEDVMFIVSDTRDHCSVARAVKEAVERFGAPDAVFANAGIHRSNTIVDITDEEFDLVIHTNIYGTYHTLKEVVPYMIKGGGGCVVINASDQSKVGKYHSFAYGLTKGALGQITKSLALDLAQYNIRVNAVCPGTIYTPLVEKIFSRISDEKGIPMGQLLDEENNEHPIGRMGKPEEVAELVAFLADEKSSFCTGALFSIDGGLTAN